MPAIGHGYGLEKQVAYNTSDPKETGGGFSHPWNLRLARKEIPQTSPQLKLPWRRISGVRAGTEGPEADHRGGAERGAAGNGEPVAGCS